MQSVPGRKPRTRTLTSLPQGRDARLALTETPWGTLLNATVSVGERRVEAPERKTASSTAAVAAAVAALRPMPNRIRRRRVAPRSAAIRRAMRSARSGGGAAAGGRGRGGGGPLGTRPPKHGRHRGENFGLGTAVRAALEMSLHGGPLGVGELAQGVRPEKLTPGAAVVSRHSPSPRARCAAPSIRSTHGS